MLSHNQERRLAQIAMVEQAGGQPLSSQSPRPCAGSLDRTGGRYRDEIGQRT